MKVVHALLARRKHAGVRACLESTLHIGVHRRVLRKDADEAMGAWLDRHGIAHRTVDLTVGSTK